MAVGRLSEGRLLDLAQLAQQLEALGVDERPGSARPAAAAVTSFRWNSVSATFDHDTSASHSATRSRPAAVSSYTLFVGLALLAHLLDGDEPNLLESGQGHVHLAGVQRLARRTERLDQPMAYLVAVGWLFGQQRKDWISPTRYP